MHASAANANAADIPLLVLRLAVLVEEPAGDVDLEPIADDIAVRPTVELEAPAVELEAPTVELDADMGGATAESAVTVDHEAAKLAALLPCVYGRKATAPAPVSWTMAVIPAK